MPLHPGVFGDLKKKKIGPIGSVIPEDNNTEFIGP